MSDESVELVQGSGNVFRDFGEADADVLQLKAILAAEIIKMLDREGLECAGGACSNGCGCGGFLADS